MIVLLLLVIIAIMLFGAAAVQGVIGALMMAVIVGLVLIVIGWEGLLWVAGAFAVYIVLIMSTSRSKARAKDVELDRRVEASQERWAAEDQKRSIDKAVAQDRKLAEEYQAKIDAQRRGGK